MIIGIVVISMQPDTIDYKTISIQLDTPVLSTIPKENPVEKIEQVEQPKSVITKPVTQEPIEEKIVTAVKNTSVEASPDETIPDVQAKKVENTPTMQTEPVTTAPAQAEAIKTPAPQKLQKSVEELMAEQNAVTSTKNTDDVDWDSLFSDTKAVATSSTDSIDTTSSKVLSGSDALSGSAASASSDTNATATSSNNQTDVAVSESTTSALNAIGKASFSDSGSGGGLTSTVSVVSNSASSNGTTIQMRDGSMRKLLDPLKPVLTISPENEKLIDSSRLVTITFTVKAEGNVLPTSIQFTPSGLLPLAVKSDLRVQIAKWRFEKALGDGQAEFKYSINKQ